MSGEVRDGDPFPDLIQAGDMIDGLTVAAWAVPADARVGEGEYWGDPDADNAGATGPACDSCGEIFDDGDLVFVDDARGIEIHVECYLRDAPEDLR